MLTLVWGEENGGTKKTTVERHKQTGSSRQGFAGALCARGPRSLTAEAGACVRRRVKGIKVV